MRIYHLLGQGKCHFTVVNVTHLSSDVHVLFSRTDLHNISERWIGIQPMLIQGAFFWDYSVDSYSGIRITEHTEYQFPKEQTLCYSENRIADVTKIKAMRPRKSRYAIFRQKTSENCQTNTITGYILSIPNKPLFRQFCYRELTDYYSVHSGIRIGAKRTQLPPIPCILILE